MQLNLILTFLLMFMDDTKLLKVENSSLARDIKSRAILNTNDRDRELYLARKKALSLKSDRIDLLEKRILRLEEQIELLIKSNNS